MYLSDYFCNFNNIVLIGGSGSGKSVLSVNLAIQLASAKRFQVHFFDLDQTKAIFRSRDFRSLLESKNVIVHAEDQFFDAPAITIGVRNYLKNPDYMTIIDVGGDDRGAAQIGQFAYELNNENTLCFYVMNPYRPWSSKDDEIYKTVNKILDISHIKNYKILANPNVGKETTITEVIDGFFLLQKAIQDNDKIFACCIDSCYYDAVSGKLPVPLISIEHFSKMYWD